MEESVFSKILNKYRKSDRKGQALLSVLLIGLLLFIFGAIDLLVGNIIAILNGDGTSEAIYYGLTAEGLKISAVVCVALLLLIMLKTVKMSFRNEVESVDENGRMFSKNKAAGRARWMSEAEMKKTFYCGDVSGTTSTIYGKVGEGRKMKVVAWKKPEVGASGNRNDMILATMGAGKTVCYVIPELIQTILRGDSFVCTDPKAEVYETLAKFCKDKGVDVHILNMVDLEYSEFWNCLSETIDPETERLSGSRLNEFASIFMQNSGGGNQDFWYTSALNLVKAVIGYVAWEREAQVIDGFADLYKRLTGVSENDPVIVRMRNTLCPFPWCKDMIRQAAKATNQDMESIEELIRLIQYEKPKWEDPATKEIKPLRYNIGEVFDALLSFTNLTEKMEAIKTWHPASISYRMYMTNDTETVRKSALQGAQLRFQLFSDNKIKDVLSHDGINISDINRKQSAYFVIMSDKSETTRPIVSLFFSFLFKDAMDTYDKYEHIKNDTGGVNDCVGITAMLEEFFSIGVICGDPVTFGKIVSTCRSRKIYVKIILQYYAQLEELYGPNIRDAIQGACSTTVFLGANDPGTMAFINTMTGKASVLSESHKESNSVFGTNATVDSNISITNSDLLAPEEIRRWKKKVLLIKQGEYPLKIDSYFWQNHPEYKKGNIQMVSIKTYNRPLDERMEDILIKDSQKGDIDTLIHEKISSLKQVVIDGETGEIITDPEKHLHDDYVLIPVRPVRKETPKPEPSGSEAPKKIRETRPKRPAGNASEKSGRQNVAARRKNTQSKLS